MKDYKAIDEAFDEKFPDGVMIDWDEKNDEWEVDVTDEVKDFLHSQIDQAIEKHNQQVIEKISLLPQTTLPQQGGSGGGTPGLIYISDVISSLKAQELIGGKV